MSCGALALPLLLPVPLFFFFRMQNPNGSWKINLKCVSSWDYNEVDINHLAVAQYCISISWTRRCSSSPSLTQGFLPIQKVTGVNSVGGRSSWCVPAFFPSTPRFGRSTDHKPFEVVALSISSPLPRLAIADERPGGTPLHWGWPYPGLGTAQNHQHPF